MLYLKLPFVARETANELLFKLLDWYRPGSKLVAYAACSKWHAMTGKLPLTLPLEA